MTDERVKRWTFPSRGAAVLKVASRPCLHLEGDYWMERGTHGRITSVGYTPKLYTTFAAAQGASYRAIDGTAARSPERPDS